MPSQFHLSPASRPRRLSPERATQHLDALVRLAYALCGSRQDAEDVVQDVFVRVLSRPRLMLGGHELSYLSRCVRNELHSRWRQAGRRPRSVALHDDDGHATPAGDPVVHLQAREVYAAIADLPDQYRDAVALVDVAGLSYHEAAGLLAVPVGTVMSRLYRGRARVVAAVEGAASPAAARRVVQARPADRPRRRECRRPRGVLLCDCS
jgi:RNA polymerase sigma-70 factor (ECF subfamily)